MILLSVDPGIRGCGAALWNCGKLVACAYVKNPCERGAGPLEAATMARAVFMWSRSANGAEPTNLSLEWPQVYRAGKQKGDNNDLLPLAGVQTALSALLPIAGIEVFKPSEWKGQVPKDVMENRILGRLAGNEIPVFRHAECPKSLLHNVIDALGIGLKALRRL